MYNQVNEQDIFSAVWQRVSEASHSAAEPTPDERDVLAGLIDAETENSAFYLTASAHTPGSCSSLFKRLADVSEKRLGRLRTFYYLLYGAEHKGSAEKCTHPRNTLSALRSAYWRESDTASRLISASAVIGSGKFNSCAAEFARLSTENAERIMQFIDRIMQ